MWARAREARARKRTGNWTGSWRARRPPSPSPLQAELRRGPPRRPRRLAQVKGHLPPPAPRSLPSGPSPTQRQHPPNQRSPSHCFCAGGSATTSRLASPSHPPSLRWTLEASGSSSPLSQPCPPLYLALPFYPTTCPLRSPRSHPQAFQIRQRPLSPLFFTMNASPLSLSAPSRPCLFPLPPPLFPLAIPFGWWVGGGYQHLGGGWGEVVRCR
mmetsp:Transcript_42790/g.98963  ORF Transcript_42790/g.98963 Transcript_42790/m.98963 type:complete len:213 (-) Transcript_42790:13-651(-)